MPSITQRLLTRNDCYRAGRTIKPKGIMVHSLGVAQPDPNVLIKAWDNPGVEVAPHAIVGAESITQLLPWHWRGWHAGTGTSGQSANNTHISMELCEPAGHTYQGGTMVGYDVDRNAAYFADIYRNAVELAAYLCKLYHLDPLEDGVLICHSEGYKRGIASNHADVMHWWPKHGKDMDKFRAEVAQVLKGERDLTEKEIRAIVRDELSAIEAERATQSVPAWGRAEWDVAKKAGLVDGTRPMSAATRLELAVVIGRAARPNIT